MNHYLKIFLTITLPFLMLGCSSNDSNVKPSDLVVNNQDKIINLFDAQGSWSGEAAAKNGNKLDEIELLLYHLDTGLMEGISFSKEKQCGVVYRQLDNEKNTSLKFKPASYFKISLSKSGGEITSTFIPTYFCRQALAEFSATRNLDYLEIDRKDDPYGAKSKFTMHRKPVPSYQISISEAFGFKGFYDKNTLNLRRKAWYEKTIAELSGPNGAESAKTGRERLNLSHILHSAKKLKKMMDYRSSDHSIIHLKGDKFFEGDNFTAYLRLKTKMEALGSAHYYAQSECNKILGISVSLVFDVSNDFIFTENYLRNLSSSNSPLFKALRKHCDTRSYNLNLYVNNVVILGRFIDEGRYSDDKRTAFIPYKEALNIIKEGSKHVYNQQPLFTFRSKNVWPELHDNIFYITYNTTSVTREVDRIKSFRNNDQYYENFLGSVNKLAYQHSINHGFERTKDISTRMVQENKQIKINLKRIIYKNYQVNLQSELFMSIIAGDKKALKLAKSEARNNWRLPNIDKLLRTYWKTTSELCKNNTVGKPIYREWDWILRDTGEIDTRYSRFGYHMSEEFKFLDIRMSGTLAGSNWLLPVDSTIESDIILLINKHGCASSPFVAFESNYFHLP